MPNTKPTKPKPSRNSGPWLHYAGMATQLLIMIGLAVWAGLKLDAWTKFKVPVFVMALPLVAILFFLYRVIKDFTKK